MDGTLSDDLLKLCLKEENSILKVIQDEEEIADELASCRSLMKSCCTTKGYIGDELMNRRKDTSGLLLMKAELQYENDCLRVKENESRRIIQRLLETTSQLASDITYVDANGSTRIVTIAKDVVPSKQTQLLNHTEQSYMLQLSQAKEKYIYSLSTLLEDERRRYESEIGSRTLHTSSIRLGLKELVTTLDKELAIDRKRIELAGHIMNSEALERDNDISRVDKLIKELEVTHRGTVRTLHEEQSIRHSSLDAVKARTTEVRDSRLDDARTVVISRSRSIRSREQEADAAHQSRQQQIQALRSQISGIIKKQQSLTQSRTELFKPETEIQGIKSTLEDAELRLWDCNHTLVAGRKAKVVRRLQSVQRRNKKPTKEVKMKF